MGKSNSPEFCGDQSTQQEVIASGRLGCTSEVYEEHGTVFGQKPKHVFLLLALTLRSLCSKE